jgi:hypothetical protein
VEGVRWSIRGDAYIEFAQHREGDAIVHLAKLLDLFIAVRVLAAELVAGEAEDYEVRVCGLEVLFTYPRQSCSSFSFSWDKF